MRFARLAQCMSAVDATAAAHPCDACANKASALGPNRRSQHLLLQEEVGGEVPEQGDEKHRRGSRVALCGGRHQIWGDEE